MEIKFKCLKESKKNERTNPRVKKRKTKEREVTRSYCYHLRVSVCVNLWENTVNRCATAYIVWLYTIISRQKKKRSQSIWDEIFIGIVTVLFFVPHFTFSSRIISILKRVFLWLCAERKRPALHQERWSVKKFLVTIDKRTNFYDFCCNWCAFRHIVSYT